jgi:hypothetical protein
MKYLFRPYSFINICIHYNVSQFSTCNILYSDVDPENNDSESEVEDDDAYPENGDIYPEDGTSLDRSQFIANKYYEDKVGLDKYFQDKENAIRSSYREDSNSAAVSGVQASELDT